MNNMEKQEEINPHNICIWKPEMECENCTITMNLKCHYNLGDLARFIGLFLTFLIPAVVGVLMSGYGMYLPVWIVLAVLFFGFWEIKILCSHCPFYAEKGFLLHCNANYGLPKFWKYNPAPMSTFEKIQLMVWFGIMFGFPFPFLIISKQYILLFLTFWGLSVFLWTLQKYTCTSCVNFSCPLNRVKKEVIDEFLMRNQIMKKAWGERGWKIS